MKALDSILARIARYREGLVTTITSDADFRSEIVTILSELLSFGIDVRIAVRRKSPDAEIASYRAQSASGRENPAEYKNAVTEEDKAVTSIVEVWYASGGRVPKNFDTCMRSIGALSNDHWGIRDAGTLLPLLKTPGNEKRILSYAARLAREGRAVTVLHTDLDKFKDVNTEFGEPTGDAVLAEFSARFRLAFSDVGVVFRKGGEEFSAVLADEDPVRCLLRTEQFRKTMETDKFELLGRPNTCSIGLAIYPAEAVERKCGSFDDLSADAQRAERKAKEDGRNCIRLPSSGLSDPVLRCGDLERAAIDARRGLIGDRAPRNGSGIGDVLTEVIKAELVARAPRQACGVAAQAALRIGLRFGLAETPLVEHAPLEALMPVGDWAATVARSYLRATFESGKPLLPDDKLSFEVETNAQSTGELNLQIVRDETVIERVPLASKIRLEGRPGSVLVGKPWFPSDRLPTGGIPRWTGRKNSEEMASLSTVLLLPVGDAAILIAKEARPLVADVVEVDDRPVIGGGLPDFWQSNVARVIRACLQNPNIRSIVALGKADNATATLTKLRLAPNEWSQQVHDLQRRLSISSEHLQLYSDRSVDVLVLDNPSEQALHRAILASIHSLKPDTQIGAAVSLDAEVQRRRLARSQPHESNRLTIADGLRTSTMAYAYPEAINLLRTSEVSPQIEMTQRRFREFTAFKLVLTNPFCEPIPDYWKTEDKALRDYYETNFGRETGLFGAPLHSAQLGRQSLYERGLAATVSALQESKPTRRVMLPINSLPDRFDQPLGLGAIQILPRFRDGRWHLDFQWVWRTVEALVGFPFSAYGSITWSKEFFDAVDAEMRRVAPSVPVQLGELTYLALSFHMFLDVGDTEIARAIVQDASH